MNCSYYTSPDDMPDYEPDYDKIDLEFWDDSDDPVEPYDDYNGHYDDGVLL